jgi:hypothetical protein
MRRPFLFASLMLLTACSASAEQAAMSTQDSLSARTLSSVPGPPRLLGTCTIDGGSEKTFEAAAGDDRTVVFLDWIGNGDYAAVEVSLGEDPEYASELRTVPYHAWTGSGAPSVKVTKPSLHLGEKVTLEDTRILPGHTVSCTATLSTKPMLSFVAKPSTSVALEELTTARLSIDIPLPNRLSCGLAWRFPHPIPREAAEQFTAVFRVEGPNVTATVDDDHTITLRTPSEHGWDAFVTVETRDRVPLGEELRMLFSIPPAPASVGTLEVLPCPSPP